LGASRVLLAAAVVLVGLAAFDRARAHRFTLRARIWLLVAAIFAVVGALNR
jgi:hypothetical protein